jgi:hypothetical protein
MEQALTNQIAMVTVLGIAQPSHRSAWSRYSSFGGFGEGGASDARLVPIVLEAYYHLAPPGVTKDLVVRTPHHGLLREAEQRLWPLQDKKNPMRPSSPGMFTMREGQAGLPRLSGPTVVDVSRREQISDAKGGGQLR